MQRTGARGRAIARVVPCYVPSVSTELTGAIMAKLFRTLAALGVLGVGAIGLLAGASAVEAQVAYLVPENYWPVQKWRSGHLGQGATISCGRTIVRSVGRVIPFTNINPADPQLVTFYDIKGAALHSLAVTGPIQSFCNFVNFNPEPQTLF